MKKQREVVTVTMMTRFRFWDRVKILFGWNFAVRCSTPVEFDMKRGLSVLKSQLDDELVAPRKPNPFAVRSEPKMRS